MPGVNPAALRGTFLHAKEQDDDEGDLLAHEKRALAKNKRLSKLFIETTLANGTGDPGPAKVFHEREFFLCKANGDPVNPPVPGHTDEIVWYPEIKTIFVFDSKFGRYPVTRAELNWQLRLYFLMVNDDIGADRVYAAIRQPYLDGADAFHSVEYRAEDANPARNEALAVLKASAKPDAPRRVSEACTFCKAAGTLRCPESLKLLQQVAAVKVAAMKPAELEAYVPTADMAWGVIEALYARIKWIAEKYPHLLALYEFGKPRKDPRITDNVRCFEALKAAGVFSESYVEGVKEFLTHCCKVSLTKITAYVADKQSREAEDAERHVLQTLGNRLSTDDPSEAIVETKFKKPSLQKRKK